MRSWESDQCCGCYFRVFPKPFVNISAKVKESVSRSVVSDSLLPNGLWSPPGSSVYGILQTRILELDAIPFSRGSSRLRDPAFQSDSLLSEPPGNHLLMSEWTWISCRSWKKGPFSNSVPHFVPGVLKPGLYLLGTICTGPRAHSTFRDPQCKFFKVRRKN